MLPKLGKAIVKPRNFQLKSLIQGTLINRAAPLTPSLATRAISIGTTTILQKDDTATKITKSAVAKPTMTESSVFERLADFKSTGNLKGAIKTVQNAKDSGIATPAIYICLVDMLRDLPFDMDSCATVANWFYSENTKLPLEVLENMDVWKSVLKMGFRFGATYRAEDLRALVDKFTEIFDLTTLNDQTAWELLMRAYGMMDRSDAITACLVKNDNPAQKRQFYASAVISYASSASNDKVEEMLEKLKRENLLTRHILLKLIRCYGFQGDISQTSKYVDMCNQLYPDSASDKTMLLIAHKAALEKMCNQLEATRGVHGLDLKPTDSTQLDELHQSWSQLTKDMFVGEKPVDITDCNVVLEYLAIANRIDPVQFPMEKAESIFETYMPAHNIKPNEVSHRVMMVGYAKSREYNSEGNVRLDKTLEVVSKMQVAGINTLNHATFHALFRACIPHRDGHYYYDNYRLNSLLPIRSPKHNQFKLDPRVFEIEKIMLEAHIPHDRYTFSTLITCLAAGGKNQAFRSRWRTLKVHGLKRDVGIYRTMFALSSLEPTQAKRAMTVVKSEMDREIAQHRLNWDTYAAMLDCCVTAQLPEKAKEVMEEMKKEVRYVHKEKHHADDLVKWPYLDSPDYYLPMVRASVAIEGLNTTADKLLTEMDSKNVVYSQGIWEAKLSKLALEGNREGIQQLFNKYTMSRFENQGNIPVPVREKASPIIPFPTAPYTRLDMEFIDVYISTLLDNQNVSLVFDVLRTLNEQTDKISMSLKTLRGIILLAEQEKSKGELQWLSENVLPKITTQNKNFRLLKKKIDHLV
ncbi:hypothetical protein INT47_002831 [Mucor saturninus]|uniref:Mitochondrial group I intron splicing factor CCM1 n=1 Tax=Mucor saturninus TaxID=64648 RepID=A0A8H7UTG5_9FUNG|nr:hypothetical protein INT47_002831 [Mucor saturninus]